MEEICANCKHCKTLYIPPVYDEPRLASGKPFHTLSGSPVCSVLDGDSDKWQIMWLGNTDGMCEMFSEKGVN